MNYGLIAQLLCVSMRATPCHFIVGHSVLFFCCVQMCPVVKAYSGIHSWCLCHYGVNNFNKCFIGESGRGESYATFYRGLIVGHIDFVRSVG